VNTLVIDIKTDNGHVLFETNNPLAIEMNNVRSKYNKASLEEFKNDKNLYLIGRVVVFQDPLFAKNILKKLFLILLKILFTLKMVSTLLILVVKKPKTILLIFQKKPVNWDLMKFNLTT
jgi:hypothetical protein